MQGTAVAGSRLSCPSRRDETLLAALGDAPEIRFGGVGQNDTRAFAVMVHISKSLPMPPYSAPRPIARLTRT
jgi:hypothetical protein